jgi:YHYH protein
MNPATPYSIVMRTAAASLCGLASLLIAGCGDGGGGRGSSTTPSLAAGYKQARWQSGVSVSFPDDCTMVYTSTGTPSHGRAAYQLVYEPASGKDIVATTPIARLDLSIGRVPVGTTLRTYEIDICPRAATTTTATGGGPIARMISGAALFNPYEGDGRTVAMSDNVSVTFTDSSGAVQTAAFIDPCNGHTTPSAAGAQYHYHSWSPCLAATADGPSGPSHIVGVALDGYPVYGDKDNEGRTVPLSALDECNGLTSATPEFPAGVYHYVLPRAALTTAQAAPRCYRGTVSPRLAFEIAAAGSVCIGGRSR